MRPGELGGLEWEKWALKGGGSEAVSARLARGLARALSSGLYRALLFRFCMRAKH
jgi:hypothetical protein